MTSLLRTAPAALAAFVLLSSGAVASPARSDAAATPAPAKAPEADVLRTITAPEGFSVRMPGEPQPMRQKVRIPAGDVATAAWTLQHEGRVFAVSLADYPAKVVAARPAQTFLDEAAQGLVTQVRGTIAERQPLTLQGYPGEALRVTSDLGEVTARVFLVGARLYTLLVLGAPGAESPLAQAFLESLKLIDPPPVIEVSVAAPSPSPTPTPASKPAR